MHRSWCVDAAKRMGASPGPVLPAALPGSPARPRPLLVTVALVLRYPRIGARAGTRSMQRGDRPTERVIGAARPGRHAGPSPPSDTSASCVATRCGWDPRKAHITHAGHGRPGMTGAYTARVIPHAARTRSSIVRPNLPHECVDARTPTDAPPRRASAPGPARGHARGAAAGSRLTARAGGRTLCLSGNDKGS